VCGRYTLGVASDELVEAFDVPPPAFEWSPRYNVAPGQDCPVVARDRKGTRMGLLRWGLVPGWMDDPPSGGFVNARAESAGEKPSFKEAWARRRCLVPVDGFYEWGTPGEEDDEDRESVPYWFRRPNGSLFTLAGLWEGTTFAVLTTEANPDVAPVHHRMPVLVASWNRHRWLDAATPPEEVTELAATPEGGILQAWPVSRAVNDPANDHPGLVDRTGPSP